MQSKDRPLSIQDAIDFASVEITDVENVMYPTEELLEYILLSDNPTGYSDVSVITSEESFNSVLQSLYKKCCAKNTCVKRNINIQFGTEYSNPYKSPILTTLGGEIITFVDVGEYVYPVIQQSDGKTTVDDIIDCMNLDEYTISLPTIDSILNSFNSVIGDKLYDEFIHFMKKVDTNEIKITHALITFAAYHEVTNYRISKFSEDANIVTKSTISRHKNNIQDEIGLIDSYKIPVDIGRPRDRLYLTDFNEQPIENVIEYVGSQM